MQVSEPANDPLPKQDQKSSHGRGIDSRDEKLKGVQLAIIFYNTCRQS